MPEDVLRQIWERHLGEAAEDRGFLDLGGHSLTAVRLAADLQSEGGVQIRVAGLLRDNPTLAEIRTLATAASSQTASSSEASPPQTGTRRVGRVQPLVAAQRAIWLDQQLGRDPHDYAVVGVLCVPDRIDDAALLASAREVVERHDAFGARVETFASGPALVFGPSRAPITVERFAASTDLADAVERLTEQLDPGQPPLLRLGLLSRDDGDLIIAVLDHLIGDAEALDILFTDLSDSYAGRRSAEEPTPSFAAFLNTRRQYEEEGAAAATEYWRQVLRDVDVDSRLPLLDPGHVPGGTACQARRRIDAADTAGLEQGLRRSGATIAAALVSAVGGPLGRALGGQRCLLGVPSSQRSTTADLDLVGMALGVLPVVVSVDGPAEDRLDEARDALIEGQQFTAIGVAEAVRAAGGTTSPGSSPLAAWVNDLTGRRSPEGFGPGAHYVDHELARALFPLSFYLHRVEDGLELVALTDGPLFTDPDYLGVLADQVVAELLRLAHRDSGGESGHRESPPESIYAPSIDVTRLLADAPGPAVVAAGDRHLTPDALRDLVDTITEQWRRSGAAAGAPVLVRASRDVHLLPTLLGLWQAGLVPAVIDADLPEEAARTCAAAVEAQWQTETTATARPERLARTEGADPSGSLDTPDATGPAEPTHILFTSGTTGEPRPVRMPLRATLGALTDLITELRPGPADRIGLTSGLGHDPMLRDLLVPHLSGAELCIPDEADLRNPRGLRDFVVGQRLTVLHATPGLLELLLASEPDGPIAPDLRTVLCGGEPLSTRLLERLRRALPGVRILNAYGCTESAQVASLLDVTDGVTTAGDVPVGSGCGATRVWVQRDGGTAAVGELGEVVITGPYVHPAGHGVHRTGDRGRRAPDGRIHLAGRLDRQLLIGGHRVAPESIEAIALDTPGVDHAWAGRPPSTPDALVLAVTRTGSADPRAELRHRLTRGLPRHAVPNQILLVHDFALDAHHKRVGPGRLVPTAETETGAADLTGLRGRLRDLITNTVGVTVGPTENFFDAGLSSLQLLRLHAALESELGLSLPPVALFEHPNLTALARAVEDPHDRDTPVTPRPPRRRPRTRDVAQRSTRRASLYAGVEEDSHG